MIGGAGYIGNVFIRHLLNAGIDVVSTDVLMYENAPLAMTSWTHSGYTFIKGDLRKSNEIDSALNGVSDVVLLASLVGDPISKKYPTQSQHINVDATQSLISSLRNRGLNKFIFVSTCSNYGLQPDNTPAHEASDLKPLSVYARNKVSVEEFLLSQNWDFSYTILRFATAFGLSPRMRFDLTVSEFTRDMFLRRDLLVYDADTWRPYCHVEDLSTAMLRVLDFPIETISREVFNTGCDANNFTKRSIVELIHQRIPDAPIRYKDHGSDPRNYRVNFEKIRNVLHFIPAKSVADGVDELIRAMQSGVFDNADAHPNFYGNRSIPLFDTEAVK